MLANFNVMNFNKFTKTKPIMLQLETFILFRKSNIKHTFFKMLYLESKIVGHLSREIPLQNK